jgi:hypothetical protein
LNHLKRDAGDGAGDAEDDDGDGAERVAHGEQASLQAEGVAKRKAHEGEGGTSEFAYLIEAGVGPSVFDPADIVADHDAEEDGARDAGRRVDEGRDTGPAAKRHGDDGTGKGSEGEECLEEGAVGIATDGAVGRLEELLELAEEDGDAEVEDDPLGVGFADVGELQQSRRRKEIECATEKQDSCSADDGDEPPAALEHAECALSVIAGDHHGHLVAGDGAEACVGEAKVVRDGVDDHPLAIERRDPEVEEDGYLDELDDGGGELADPICDEAQEQASLCGAIDAHG